MNRIITLIVVIILVAMVEIATCEDLGNFKPSSRDFEVEDISDVVVEQSKVEKVTWTLKEINTYIVLMELKKKEIDEQMDKLIKLKELVEREAAKVKLKNKDGKES